jgi:hypothetical protein
MINRLSESKFFAFANKKYNYSKVFEKVSFLNYAIPDNLIMDRLGVFKGYKYPFPAMLLVLIRVKIQRRVPPRSPQFPKNSTARIKLIRMNLKL